MLGGAGFLDEAHAAVDLDADRGVLDAKVGAPGLDHGGQQVGQRLALGGLGRVRVLLGDVEGGHRVICQRAGGFGLGPHGHQHPAHVGVPDDRDRFALGVGHVAALHAGAGIVAGLLVGALGDRDTLKTDAHPGVVHHGEHVFDAAVFLADEIADGAVIVAERHDRRRAGMDAQLVFQADAAQVVAVAQRAVGVDQELGHDEQRDALDAGRGVGHPGQHHVDDVVGEVVLAIGDVDLLAGNPVVAVLAHRLGADRGKVAAGLRLGQVHGPGPFARDQLAEIDLLQLVAAMDGQRLDGALVQHRAEREGHVGGLPHLLHRHRQRPGQPLSAVLGIERHAVPAAFLILLVGLP